MKKIKLKIYHTHGCERGNLKKEEYFDTMEKAHNRYLDFTEEVRPTLWVMNDDGVWKRDVNY